MDDKKKLGEILLEAGVIDKFQLKSALAEQNKWGGRLGNHLVQMGILTEELLVKALSKQLSIPYIDLAQMTIPPDVLALVPQEIAEKFHLVPVAVKKIANKKTLIVAMSDPTNLDAIDELQFRTGHIIKPAVDGDTAIEMAIRKYYYGETGPLVKPGAPIDFDPTAPIAEANVPTPDVHSPPEQTFEFDQEPTQPDVPEASLADLGAQLIEPVAPVPEAPPPAVPPPVAAVAPMPVAPAAAQEPAWNGVGSAVAAPAAAAQSWDDGSAAPAWDPNAASAAPAMEAEPTSAPAWEAEATAPPSDGYDTAAPAWDGGAPAAGVDGYAAADAAAAPAAVDDPNAVPAWDPNPPAADAAEPPPAEYDGAMASAWSGEASTAGVAAGEAANAAAWDGADPNAGWDGAAPAGSEATIPESSVEAAAPDGTEQSWAGQEALTETWNGDPHAVDPAAALEPSAVEASVAEASVAEASVAEASVAEASVAEASVAEASVAEASGVEPEPAPALEEAPVEPAPAWEEPSAAGVEDAPAWAAEPSEPSAAPAGVMEHEPGPAEAAVQAAEQVPSWSAGDAVRTDFGERPPEPYEPTAPGEPTHAGEEWSNPPVPETALASNSADATEPEAEAAPLEAVPVETAPPAAEAPDADEPAPLDGDALAPVDATMETSPGAAPDDASAGAYTGDTVTSAAPVEDPFAWIPFETLEGRAIRALAALLVDKGLLTVEEIAERLHALNGGGSDTSQ